jgi:hypothetical protein
MDRRQAVRLQELHTVAVVGALHQLIPRFPYL